MTVFDYAFLIIVGLSALLGLWRGLVSEVMALGSWVLALVAVRLFASPVADLLTTAIEDPVWRTVAAYALVVIIVLALCAVVRHIFRALLRATGLSSTDKFLGVLFGAARGLLIVFVVVMLGGMVGAQKLPWWEGAIFAAPMETAVITAKPWLPDVVADKISFD